jgi:hypothetical protein
MVHGNHVSFMWLILEAYRRHKMHGAGIPGVVAKDAVLSVSITFGLGFIEVLVCTGLHIVSNKTLPRFFPDISITSLGCFALQFHQRPMFSRYIGRGSKSHAM